MDQFVLTLGLVLLHGLDGREIYINPETVTTMRAPIHGKENKVISAETQCVLNTTDGKFISVIETCDKVRELFQKEYGK
jgi:hypothetical protein